MDEMWWRQGEDDGSLLSQMTKDAAAAGAAVRHSHKARRSSPFSQSLKASEFFDAHNPIPTQGHTITLVTHLRTIPNLHH